MINGRWYKLKILKHGRLNSDCYVNLVRWHDELVHKQIFENDIDKRIEMICKIKTLRRMIIKYYDRKNLTHKIIIS